MKKVITICILIIAISAPAMAGTRLYNRREVNIVPVSTKCIQEKQELKQQLASSEYKISELESHIDWLKSERESIIDREPNVITKEVTKEVTKEIEKEYVPWYYWAILIGAIII